MCRFDRNAMMISRPINTVSRNPSIPGACHNRTNTSGGRGSECWLPSPASSRLSERLRSGYSSRPSLPGSQAPSHPARTQAGGWPGRAWSCSPRPRGGPSSFTRRLTRAVCCVRAGAPLHTTVFQQIPHQSPSCQRASLARGCRGAAAARNVMFSFRGEGALNFKGAWRRWEPAAAGDV